MRWQPRNPEKDKQHLAALAARAKPIAETTLPTAPSDPKPVSASAQPDLETKVTNLEQELISLKNSLATYFNNPYASNVPPADNMVPVWDGSAAKWLWQTIAGVGATPWRVFYSDGSGVVTELALGAANTVLTSNGATSAPSFAAGGGVKSPIAISTGSAECIGTNIAALALAAPASAAFTASKVLYIPFILHEDVTLAQVFWYNGATVGGGRQIDVGVVNSAGTKMVSSGATTTSGTNAIQVVNVADTALPAGRYYLAIANNATAATFFAWAVTDDALADMGCAQEDGTAIPSTATFATCIGSGIVTLPRIGFTTRSVV